MRVLVTGGRDYDDRDRVYDVLDILNWKDDVVVATGGARGADALALDWAEYRSTPFATYLADWQKHGKAAGPIRNQEMLDKFLPDVVVAFPGGKGTAHMVSIARKTGVRVLEIA